MRTMQARPTTKPLFSIILLCCLSLSTFASDKKTISLAYIDYPPYYGESLPSGGPIGEIITHAFTLAGYEIKREQMPWSRALKWTQEGRYDAIYTAWFRQEREEHFIFSKPLPSNELVLFKRKELNFSYTGLDSLKPFRIGVLRGYALPPGFDDKVLTLDIANTAMQSLSKLAANRVTLVIMDRAVGRHMIKHKLPQFIGKLEAITPAISIEKQYVMFSKAAPRSEEKVKDFNAGLSSLEDSGELQVILERHDL
jgi:polar amino acid transport system substrate-binding protein